MSIARNALCITMLLVRGKPLKPLCYINFLYFLHYFLTFHVYFLHHTYMKIKKSYMNYFSVSKTVTWILEHSYINFQKILHFLFSYSYGERSLALGFHLRRTSYHHCTLPRRTGLLRNRPLRAQRWKPIQMSCFLSAPSGFFWTVHGPFSLSQSKKMGGA